jgi:maltooligosyltrehalose trehalohydrolase
VTPFRLFAPKPARVELEVGESIVELTSQGGVWSGPMPAIGSDYVLRLDRDTRIPDPRSRWQPRGVHGPSRVPPPFEGWTDARFVATPWRQAIVYELHAGTFSAEGTFEGAIEKLGHLVELGVTHVELMPVASFPGARGWGYDGVGLFAPHEAYGGPHGLARFVDACHARGLAVLLDVVYNHLGPDGNHLGALGPYFTSTVSTPWGAAVNLDERGSDEVRRFFTDNARMWLEDYHFDGLRLDAVHGFLDRSATHFLEELAGEVRALSERLGRELVLVAESDANDPRIVRGVDRGGYGIDAVWSDDFHHALHALLTGETHGYYADYPSFDAIATAFERGFVYAGEHSVYRGRRFGRSPEGLAGERFVVCAQNHDQVGNRPLGERLCHLVSPGRCKIAATLTLLSPFVPMLFQGEEWAASSPFFYFTDHEDAGLARAVTEGRAREAAAQGVRSFDAPDPQACETFERSKLDWRELGRAPHREMLDYHRALIALRKRCPELGATGLGGASRCDRDRRTLTFERGRFAIALNLSTEERRLRGSSILLASDANARIDRGELVLGPESVAVIE